MHIGKRKLIAWFATAALGATVLIGSAGIAGAAATSPDTGTTAAAPVSRIVVLTQADNGATVNVAAGTYVVVNLGTRLNWAVRSTNPAVLDSVSVGASTGVSVFRAEAAGRATLIGLGRPLCDPGKACPMFIEYWSANVNVKGIVPTIVG